MDDDGLEFYATPAALSALPADLAPDEIPVDPAGSRSAVQGLLVHRDWLAAYGTTADARRLAEQHLRSVREVVERARELSPAPLTEPRPPDARVLGICRHVALLHTALLRARGTPARVRCGFGRYFERDTWHDHWITEWWDGGRWVRDDPQVDAVQRALIEPDFDPHDQPPGCFLTGAEAWVAARRGEVDPTRFGIFDMWGLSFIGGNVLLDLACLNKVELLPWDVWGHAATFGPHDDPDVEVSATIDELAALVLTDDVSAIRARYEGDERLRVPERFQSFVDGTLVPASLPI